MSFNIHISDIKEVWKFTNFISSEMPKARTPENEIVESIRMIKTEVKGLMKG